ncbi:MAG: glycosyltransferase [Bacteroidota bacterium]
MISTRILIMAFLIPLLLRLNDEENRLMSQLTYVLMPVFEDWISTERLILRMKQEFPQPLWESLFFVLVDDASNQVIPERFNIPAKAALLRLHRNLGHQRAIAIGLAYIVNNKTDVKAILVMDADGEDSPSGMISLINASEGNPGKIVFAARRHRENAFVFKVGYFIYRALFAILTGTRISFGNFCYLPFPLAKRIIHVSEIWNHFPGGVIRSKLPFVAVPVDRAPRINGKSHMDTVSLILHGLGAISVHLETVTTRLLLFFLSLLLLSGAGIVTVVWFKLFTTLAIPGWATSAFSGLALMFLQSLFTALLLVFIILNYRTQKQIIPAKDYMDYVAEVSEISIR